MDLQIVDILKLSLVVKYCLLISLIGKRAAMRSNMILTISLYSKVL